MKEKVYTEASEQDVIDVTKALSAIREAAVNAEIEAGAYFSAVMIELASFVRTIHDEEKNLPPEDMPEDYIENYIVDSAFRLNDHEEVFIIAGVRAIEE